MKLKHRAAVFYAVAVVSLLAIGANMGERLGLVPMVLLLWLVVVGVVQSAVLKCPHCHKSPVITPSGKITPFVGDACKHCGKAY